MTLDRCVYGDLPVLRCRRVGYHPSRLSLSLGSGYLPFELDVAYIAVFQRCDRRHLLTERVQSECEIRHQGRILQLLVRQLRVLVSRVLQWPCPWWRCNRQAPHVDRQRGRRRGRFRGGKVQSFQECSRGCAHESTDFPVVLLSLHLASRCLNLDRLLKASQFRLLSSSSGA